MKILFIMVKEDYIDPLNIELLSALAKREGHETFLNVLEHNNLKEEIATILPDVVAFSAKTGESKVLLNANKWIKSQYGNRVLSVMGGPHPTFNHARMKLYDEDLRFTKDNPLVLSPIEETELDVLAVGEADESWPELLRRIKNNQEIDSIAGLVTKRNRRADGKVTLKDRTNFLDDLPFLDRDLVYSKTRLKNFGMRSIMASRGCPFVCTYCFNAKFNELYQSKGKTVNRYSVLRLIAELKELVRKYPTQFIKFYDDVFTFRSDDWLKEFSEIYPREIGVPFHCLTRADLVKNDPQIIHYLKQAGIKSISMSIESGNKFLREHVLKRGMTEEQMQFAFDLCHKNKINTFSNTILAIPAPILPQNTDPEFETKILNLSYRLKHYFKMNLSHIDFAQTDRKTLLKELELLGLRYKTIDYDIESVDFNIKNRVVFGEFPVLFPYPGTPVTQYTIDAKAFDGDFDKLHQNYQSESPFQCFSPSEKLQQYNLSLLGLVILAFPRFRNITVKYLIRLPLTRLYFALYFLVKAYLVGRKIYPMHYSIRHILNTIKESFLSEWLKHSHKAGEKFYKKKLSYSMPAQDILGGPWQS